MEIILFDKKGKKIEWMRRGRYKYRYLGVYDGTSESNLHIPYSLTAYKKLSKLIKTDKIRDVKKVYKQSYTQRYTVHEKNGRILFFDNEQNTYIEPEIIVAPKVTNRGEIKSPQKWNRYSDLALRRLNEWMKDAKTTSFIFYQTHDSRITHYDENIELLPVKYENGNVSSMGVAWRKIKPWEMYHHIALQNRLVGNKTYRIVLNDETICQSVQKLMIGKLPKLDVQDEYILEITNAFLKTAEGDKVTLEFGGWKFLSSAVSLYKIRPTMIASLTRACRDRGYTFTEPTVLEKYDIEPNRKWKTSGGEIILDVRIIGG